jgi:hypothetical protein
MSDLFVHLFIHATAVAGIHGAILITVYHNSKNLELLKSIFIKYLCLRGTLRLVRLFSFRRLLELSYIEDRYCARIPTVPCVYTCVDSFAVFQAVNLDTLIRFSIKGLEVDFSRRMTVPPRRGAWAWGNQAMQRQEFLLPCCRALNAKCNKN